MQEEGLNSLHGIKMNPRCPPISHLLFANNVMIFSHANAHEAIVVLHCLSTYSNWSGQCINLTKSAVFFSKNCRATSKLSINGILNLNHIPARAKYLGIPVFLSHKKSDSFIDLKDKDFCKDY
jgi:hypothetical protein